MLSRLLNWVPVLFGLNVAGVASVATVPEVVASDKKAPVATSDVTGVQSKLKDETPGRVASGSAVTRLMATSSVAPILSESFVFSDHISDASDIKSDTTQALKRQRFVARPIAVAPPRPTGRITDAKAVRKETVRRQPGQTKQTNRPVARAKHSVEGKKVVKRVVWISGRSGPQVATSKVIPFPKSKKSAAPVTRRAA